MEKTQIPYETVANDDPEKKLVVIEDLEGREITGFVSREENKLRASVLEDRGDKVFVLLPSGFNRDTAWIRTSTLDYLQGNP